jgi:hypothetical protein
MTSNWDPQYVATWDTGQPFAEYDVGLYWDIGPGPAASGVLGIDDYVNLVTSEHAYKPKFMTMLVTTIQPLVDTVITLENLPAAFDIDNAVGVQLDVVGQWVGVSRQIVTPLMGVFFNWGMPGLGWKQANWVANINQTSLVALPDNQYRQIIYGKVAANHWDGTIPGAYRVVNSVFAGTSTGVLIEDLQGMHMVYALTGVVPDAVLKALFTQGYFDLKPAGVRIDKYYTLSQPNVPYFGWGLQNAAGVAGWHTGYWGTSSPGH